MNNRNRPRKKAQPPLPIVTTGVDEIWRQWAICVTPKCTFKMGIDFRIKISSDPDVYPGGAGLHVVTRCPRCGQVQAIAFQFPIAKPHGDTELIYKSGLITPAAGKGTPVQ